MQAQEQGRNNPETEEVDGVSKKKVASPGTATVKAEGAPTASFAYTRAREARPTL